MSRKYSGGYTGTLTNAGGNSDLLSIQAADDKPIKLVRFIVSQVSEVGDAAEEALQISVQRLPATFTVGSGGSAVTPTPMDSADTACGATVRCNDTTVATTSGSAVAFGYLGWNERNTPFEMGWPDPEFRPKVKQAEGLIVRCDTTPADDLTVNIYFEIEEE